jgi:hypothetical protein
MRHFTEPTCFETVCSVCRGVPTSFQLYHGSMTTGFLLRSSDATGSDPGSVKLHHRERHGGSEVRSPAGHLDLPGGAD